MSRKSRSAPALSPGWAVYYRVSNEDRQHPENSVPAQRRDVLAKLVEPSGLPVIREYIDLESGKDTAGREQFLEMIEAGRQGLFSHLGVQKWERFGRNLLKALMAEEELRGIGVQIYAANMAGVDTTSSSGWLTKTLQQLLAEWDNRNRGELVIERMKVKLERGEWCWVAPDGYQYEREYVNPKKSHSWLIVDEQRAPIVRSLFQLFHTGDYSIRTLAEEMNEHGYRQASGGRWTPQGVYRALNNEFYAGWCISARWGIRARGQHEPLVSQEAWDECQSILHRRARRPRGGRHVYPLGGLLWSLEGNCRMYNTTCKGERCDWIRYHYTKRKVDGKRIYVQCELVEAQVPRLLAHVQVTPQERARLGQEYAQHVQQTLEKEWRDEKQRLRRQAHRLERESENLLRLATKGYITDEEFARKRSEIGGELASVRGKLNEFTRVKIAQANRVDQALQLLSRAPELWPVLSPQDQRVLIELIFRQIVVDREGQLQEAALWPPLEWLVEKKKGDGSNCVPPGTPDTTFFEPLTWPAPALLPRLERLLA